MRRPSPRMQPHVVSATYQAWDADMDGGRLARPESQASGLRCFVQPGEARTLTAETPKTGDRA